ncbi:hypothetical protein COX68_02525 [Candidatus Falkowbacteria bacterium CG_4_10_14_0_2_um_filter_41_15]|uniref:Uncharacterized protein n=1 Tax=Candidatus Falkowbacteria bacterium CG_4_10_14_0_2_um_filter_41_15 TaxID=1974554 RepID=A0A2M7VYZ3_9BACT|nr:MAG: hypothetical protein COX68_02525 [Candidatus Falkowbacteria bacterium CG_4_10_14_0_2_um_filter_41_15]
MNGTNGPLSRLTSKQNLYYSANGYKNPKSKSEGSGSAPDGDNISQGRPQKGGLFYLLFTN